AICWAAGVFIPLTLAKTKTPSATLPGWPAVWLIGGALVSRAVRREGRLEASVWCATALASALFFALFGGRARGIGLPSSPEPARALPEHLWLIYLLLSAIGIGAILWRTTTIAPRAARMIVTAAAAVASLALLGQSTWSCWK